MDNISIYKITCETGKIYYGSTKRTLKQRLYNHIMVKDCTSRDFINPKIELLETCKKENQKEREGYYIKNFECVNIRTPGRTKKEYEKIYKQTRKIPIKCYCGSQYTPDNKNVHFRTKNHRAYDFLSYIDSSLGNLKNELSLKS
tara:strand:+ start:68 stop:499 length:432 start_codon:yes stop_codon:yes gene_type:complete